MQLFLSFILSLGGIQIYFLLLRLGIYRRYPMETYALMALGVFLAFRAARKKKGFWRYFLASVNGILLLTILGWTLYYSRLPVRNLPFMAGQAMPPIVLVDQDSKRFASEDLKGKTAALYLFYRGDW